MYIVSVIPLVKIPFPNPQILSYFCAEKINIGGTVKIPIRKKKIKAIVVGIKDAEKQRLQIKKLVDFQIKPIDKIISQKPVLDEKQIKLLFWISDYYFAPTGLIARIFLSKKLPVYNKRALNLTPKTKALVFAPFKNLKSITIEDESSDLYRSWGRRPYYDVRTIAKELAKIHKAKLIVKSEPQKDIGPKNTQLVDMREEMRNNNFSIISRELEEKLKNSNKAILYIARRGTSTIVLCRDCGYVAMCANCDVPMVYHEDKASRKLVCHHCGKDDIAPVLCPKCKSIKIKYLGAGTQKVETEIKKLLPVSPAGGPGKNIFRLDSDITGKPEQQQKIIKEFIESDNTVLIGSQMLLDKGLIADLTAIVSIDTILNLPDYKASERVFQTIVQVKKMASKEFLLQTYNPESFAINSAIKNDYKTFYKEELKNRKKFNYPPFSQLIKLTYSHRDPIKAKNESKILFEKLKQQIKNLKINNAELLGPTPSFISRIYNRYQWNIIIKSQIKDLETRNQLLIIIPSYWEIGVDPESLL